MGASTIDPLLRCLRQSGGRSGKPERELKAPTEAGVASIEASLPISRCDPVPTG